MIDTNNIEELRFHTETQLFDRMYREMEDAGLPDPEYHVSSFMLCATLKNQKWVATHQQTGQVAPMIPPMMKLRSKIKY